MKGKKVLKWLRRREQEKSARHDADMDRIWNAVDGGIALVRERMETERDRQHLIREAEHSQNAEQARQNGVMLGALQQAFGELREKVDFLSERIMFKEGGVGRGQNTPKPAPNE